MRILLIEDDELVGGGIRDGLHAHGFIVDYVANASDARTALTTGHADLAVLDLGLPDRDGMALLRDLRAADNPLPVLVLTARDALDDRVAGLEAGADDYLLKPFDLDELVARIRALLRRSAGRASEVITHAGLALDTARREITLHGEPFALPRRELLLLEALLHAPDRILTAEQLQDRIYGFDEPVASNAVNVHIHHLRQKFGSGIVETVRGLGYRLGRPQPTSDP